MFYTCRAQQIKMCVSQLFVTVNKMPDKNNSKERFILGLQIQRSHSVASQVHFSGLGVRQNILVGGMVEESSLAVVGS